MILGMKGVMDYVLNIRMDSEKLGANLRVFQEMTDSKDNLHNIGEATDIVLPDEVVAALQDVVKTNLPLAERRVRRQVMRHMTTVEDRLEQPVNDIDSSERTQP